MVAAKVRNRRQANADAPDKPPHDTPGASAGKFVKRNHSEEAIKALWARARNVFRPTNDSRQHADFVGAAVDLLRDAVRLACVQLEQQVETAPMYKAMAEGLRTHATHTHCVTLFQPNGITRVCWPSNTFSQAST